MGVEKSPWIFSDWRAKREHFQALGHRRWGRRILPVEGAPWNVCQTRYREFPKFEKHLELDTALFFLPEVWKALRVGDMAPFFLELVNIPPITLLPQMLRQVQFYWCGGIKEVALATRGFLRSVLTRLTASRIAARILPCRGLILENLWGQGMH